MAVLTPELREYKERTLNQLLTNLPLLEAKLVEENRPNVTASLERQLVDIQAHIGRLQQELADGVSDEPVADELCQRVARALSKEKFHLAKRYLTKLEAIEPFYPGIERLRNEAEAGRASRRTRSIAEGKALPYGAAALPGGDSAVVRAERGRSITRAPGFVEGTPSERGRLARFFDFHIVVSCLVVSLIICVMTGMGGITLLQWLIEGN